MQKAKADPSAPLTPITKIVIGAPNRSAQDDIARGVLKLAPEETILRLRRGLGTARDITLKELCNIAREMRYASCFCASLRRRGTGGFIRLRWCRRTIRRCCLPTPG